MLPQAPTIYKADATSAGKILDLPQLFPNAQKKMLRIVRTYAAGTDREHSRTELVPWSPVIEIYLKIKQTLPADQIRSFATSDEQAEERRRKDERNARVSYACSKMLLNSYKNVASPQFHYISS